MLLSCSNCSNADLQRSKLKNLIPLQVWLQGDFLALFLFNPNENIMKISKTLLVFSFVFFSVTVFADTYPATSTMVYRSSGYGHDGVNYSSLLAVCASISNSQNRYTSGSNGISCAYSYYADGSNKSYGPVDNNNPMQVITSYVCSNGGTVSGSSCINAPACTSPQVRNSSTGVCEAPPVTCTLGQTKTLLILSGTYPSSGTPPTITLNHDRTATQEAPLTVSQGGCVYTIPSNPKQNTGCSTNATGLMYCRVQATQSGAYLSGSDTALDAALTTDQTPVPSANPGCILTATGDEICATTPKLNCGTVNGTEVCVKDGALQSNGFPATIIDGHVIPSTPNENGQTQRCFQGTDGVSTCVNLPVTSTCGSGTFFTCITPEKTANNPAPTPIPISKDPVTVTKHSSVTNPDNSRTVTDTTTVDIVGSSPYKQTQQINAAGETVSTTYTGAILGANGAVSTVPGDGSDNADIGSPGAAKTPDDFSGIDTVFAAGTSAMSTATGGISASNFLSSAPVPQSAGNDCQTVPMNYKSLHYTFDPCGRLAMFREMFAYLLYIMTVYSIYEIAVRPSVNA